MTTPEQQARDMLERMGIRNTHQRESAGELVELANLIAESAALKAGQERDRMRLVACEMVALADTPTSAATAREMHPDYKSDACDAVARRVDECIKLRAELQALRGSAEPVAWLFKAHKPGKHVVCAGLAPEAVGLWPLDQWDYVEETPLYTRPAVPLTDERIFEYVHDAGLDWHAGWTLDECEPNRYAQFARAIEAHIKGTKT